MPQDLIAEYRRIAALGGNFRGLSVLMHAEEIARLCKEHQPRTLLDYGSGAGDQYRDPHNVHRLWGLKRIDVRLFDPAFKGNHVRPDDTMFDAIICSDVLEHIPEDKVIEVIGWIMSHARKFVWASVCCRPAKKLFEDGTNMHVTVKPLGWWHEKFSLARTLPHLVHFDVVETP